MPSAATLSDPVESALTPQPSMGSETVPAMPRSGRFEIMPFGVARLGGVPFDLLDAFEFPRSVRQQGVLEEAEEALEEARQDLLDHLQRAVGEQDPGADRKALLRGARNLRRQSKLSDGQLGDLRRLGLETPLDAWLGCKRDLALAEEQAETIYDDELAKSRQALRRVAQDPRLLKGLVLASPTLLEGFQASLRQPLERLAYNRLQRRLELGLLKYLSRSAAKTTPFSTFTATAPVTFDGCPSAPLLELPEAAPPVSSAVLNKVIYALLHPWLEATPALFPCFDVSLNPSLHVSGDGYGMLSSEEGREQQARLRRSPALDVPAQILRTSGGTLPYDGFVERLAHAFEVDLDALRPRVDRMLASGFLSLNTGIADGEHRWAEQLRERLASSKHGVAQRVVERLGTLQGLVESYTEADAARRPALLRRLHGEVDTLWSDVGLEERGDAASTATPRLDSVGPHLRNVRQSPLYEDACSPDPVRLNARRLHPMAEALSTWTELMGRMSQRGAFHANLRAFYDQHFASHGRVPFPIFYTAFYRGIFEPMLKAEQNPAGSEFARAFNPYGLDFMSQSMRASGEMAETLRRLWASSPSGESLHLGRRDLHVDGLRATFRGAAGSVNVFGHLVPAAEGLGPVFERDLFVLEKAQVLAGMGKYFSRFLYQFDATYSEQVRRRNSRRRNVGHRDVLVAELCDDSAFSFNANLHPHLTDAEINYPARLTGLDGERNLPLSDLVVCPDADDPHRLRLLHGRLDKDVLPVDLGFLNPTRRPPLFRVLKLFSPLFQHQVLFPWSTEAGVAPPDDAVVHRPRMVFQDRLVVSRRAWRVPAALLRRELDGLTPAQALRHLEVWRLRHGMPNEVYVHSHPMERDRQGPDAIQGKQGSSSSEAGGRTYSHKPQFLSFSSGLFAQLLADEVRDHEGTLIFEEMLPHRGALAERSGRPHVAELVLQLDRGVHG